MTYEEFTQWLWLMTPEARHAAVRFAEAFYRAYCQPPAGERAAMLPRVQPQAKRGELGAAEREYPPLIRR